jgi:hypothetical protein
MIAAGALQLILVAVIAGAGAICGFIASAVMLRKSDEPAGTSSSASSPE